MVGNFFGADFFAGGFFSANVTHTGGSGWARFPARGGARLGEGKFKSFRDRRHPEEVKKRMQEALEAEIREAARPKAPVVAEQPAGPPPTLNDLRPSARAAVTPPKVDWNRVTAAVQADDTAALQEIEKRFEEEEHAMMMLLLHGRS